ncbi:MAG TPA: LemA family protein [Candidatus Acidoferrales bacterium]|nr:LemA family protein [Candidatus Acidoferrales bacterium]
MEVASGYIVGFAVFIFLAGVAVLGYSITLFNSLVQVRVDVDTAWSNIDVLLKQRHDELGKLLDSVKAYMGYEQNVLTTVTQLRTRAAGAGDGPARMEAEDALTAGIGRLFAVAENYPQLRASENFRQLQDAIETLETEIAHRREFYNASVNINNARLAQFPDMLLAGAAGLTHRELFSAAPQETADVDIGAVLAAQPDPAGA